MTDLTHHQKMVLLNALKFRLMSLNYDDSISGKVERGTLDTLMSMVKQECRVVQEGRT